MREAIIEDQDESLIRKSEHDEVGVETNNKAALEDVGQMQTCILPIKTSARKLRCIACVQMFVALSDVALRSSSELLIIYYRNEFFT